MSELRKRGKLRKAATMTLCYGANPAKIARRIGWRTTKVLLKEMGVK